MKYDSGRHHRRSIQLKNYDYSSIGLYYVILCMNRRLCLFSNIEDEEMKLNDIAIYLDEVCIVSNGGRAESYTEEAGQRVMARDEIDIKVVLGRGDAREQILTCDLSYDYVRINAEYRT